MSERIRNDTQAILFIRDKRVIGPQSSETSAVSAIMPGEEADLSPDGMLIVVGWQGYAPHVDAPRTP